MRFILSVIAVAAAGGPAGATLFAQVSSGFAHAIAGVAAVLPDPATAAVMFAGLGLVVGARRARPPAVAD
jgi:hypothetical protein